MPARKTARTPAARPAPRKRVAPRRRPPDALAMLRDDHRRVAALFAQVAKAGDDRERKGSLVLRICRELAVHAQVEDEIFYPAARTVLRRQALVDEADVEHATVRMLVAELERGKPGDDHYDAKIKVLGEYVKHHVKEEQEALFPKLRRTPLDLAVLGERIAMRKRELEDLLARPEALDDAMRRFVPIV
jgi:hemerythrin superfamily protein